MKRISILALLLVLLLCACVSSAQAQAWFDDQGNIHYYTNDATVGSDPTVNVTTAPRQDCTTLGHNWVEKSRKEATCGAAGKIEYTCSRCGQSYTKDIPATGNHTWGKWKTDEKATCKERELQYKKCSVCGKTQWRYIGEKAPHTWVEVSRTEPTCGAAGTRNLRCSVCGETSTESIPPTGQHQFGDWTLIEAATPEKMGVERRVCSVCGAAENRDVEYVRPFDTLGLTLECEPVTGDGIAVHAGDLLEFNLTLTSNCTVGLLTPDIKAERSHGDEKWTWADEHQAPELPRGWQFKTTGRYTVTEEDEAAQMLELRWTGTGLLRADDLPNMATHKAEAGQVVTSNTLEYKYKVVPKEEPEAVTPDLTQKAVGSLTVDQTSEEKEVYEEGETLTFSVTVSYTDAPAEELSESLEVLGANGVTLTLTPDENGVLTAKDEYTVTPEDAEAGEFSLHWEEAGEADADASKVSSMLRSGIKKPGGKGVTLEFKAGKKGGIKDPGLKGPEKIETAGVVLQVIQSLETTKEVYAEGDHIFVNLRLFRTGTGKLEHPLILVDGDESTGGARDVFERADMNTALFGADNYTITKADVDAGSVTLVYDGLAWKSGTYEASVNPYKENSGIVRAERVTLTLKCGKESSGKKPGGIKWPGLMGGSPNLMLTVSEDAHKDAYQLNKFGKTEDINYTLTVTNTGNKKCTVNSIRVTVGSLYHTESITPVTLAPSESFTTHLTHSFLDSDALPGTETAELAGKVNVSFVAQGSWKPYLLTTKDITSNTVTFGYDLLKDLPKKGVSSWTIPDATKASDVTLVKAALGTPKTPKGFEKGDEIVYLIGLRNDAKVALDIEVRDPLKGGDTVVEAFAGVKSGGIRFTAFKYTITQEDADNGFVQNQASAVWKDPDSGNELTKLSNITVTPVIDPSTISGLVVTKSVLSSPKNGVYYEPGEEIEFEIRVKNPYDYTYLNVGMVDKLYPGCDKFGNFDTLHNFGLNDEKVITFKYKVTDLDADLGYVQNVASARAIDGIHPVQPFLSNTVKVDAGGKAPVLFCNKTETSTPANGSFYVEGETIEYDIAVTNNGANTVSNVQITDVLESDPSKVVGTIASIAPGDTGHVTYKHTVTKDDIDAGSVINAAIAKVKYHPALPEVAVMSGTVFSSVGKDPDPLPVITVVTPGLTTITTDETGTPVVTGKADTTALKAGMAESCVRTLAAVSESGTVYTLHYCATHAQAAQAADALINGARTEEELAAAWRQAAGIWRGVLNQEYDQCANASTGSARAAFLMEKDAFEQYIDALEAQLHLLHPDEPALVAETIAELLRDRAAEGCYEMYNAGKDRADSLFEAEPITLESGDLLDACLRASATRANGDLVCSEELCEEHTASHEAMLNLMRDDMTRGEMLEAWLEAQAMWQTELDVLTNARYREADADDRLIIAACRLAFDQLLTVRQATLDALYPAAPDIAAEQLCGLLQSSVMVLCDAEE